MKLLSALKCLQTGTLTEDGLNFWAVLPIKNQQFSPQPIWKPSSELPTQSHLLVAMASCHALTRIHNQLCGDPLDLSMFEATQWVCTDVNIHIALVLLHPSVSLLSIFYFVILILQYSSERGQIRFVIIRYKSYNFL